eukprot:CAMPEP_0118685730 /NCGR_PEP_ID=MMETSP0800-20121206/7414_1 /TAXON_ID=210618 ORGANISM="Striatella unipunctata, Strain CCMP2910" /NCGR_SAMPLE_ID=MMETSP0800 /ASSEMBLY_ACC=CAM_ASM_000638 /LENGTH=155 /DNA_ID=CAMNT_0006582685 /DNA_START=48 /DNA_END=515 /DNA_ORIENTATION=+
MYIRDPKSGKTIADEASNCFDGTYFFDEVSIKRNSEIKEKDVLPIHVACSNAPQAAVINDFYKICPKSILIPTEHGNLPLHKICSSRNLSPRGPSNTSSLATVIQALMGYDKSAIQRMNDNGHTPFIAACLNPSLPDFSLDALYLLLREFPEVII